MTAKDILESYENGKHRRYNLLFSVNGGAFAIAKIFADKDTLANVLGGLSLKYLAVGMILFTIVMCVDIYTFGGKKRKEAKEINAPEVFAPIGKIVLMLLSSLICIGWFLVGFGRPS